MDFSPAVGILPSFSPRGSPTPPAVSGDDVRKNKQKRFFTSILNFEFLILNLECSLHHYWIMVRDIRRTIILVAQHAE